MLTLKPRRRTASHTSDTFAPHGGTDVLTREDEALPSTSGRRGRVRRVLSRRSGKRQDRAPRKRRRRIVLAAVLILSLFLPVPWMHVVGDQPLGLAWRLDGRLEVDGEVIDPAGRWSWLTVGRPKLVFEVLRDTVTGRADPDAQDLRYTEVPGHRPTLAEPAAAVVGLNRAGRSIPLGLLVEAHDPLDVGYPNHVTIVEINDIPLTDRASVAAAAAHSNGRIEFETADGRTFEAPGSKLPYARITFSDLAPEGFPAAIYGRLPDVWPITWFRSLALGDSHGLMVALTTYAHAAEHDLAQGRHIAGTGGIRGDGTVSRIGGLHAKAGAARDRGADVLLFPAEQDEQLVGFEPGDMELVPVRTLDEAIEWLDRPTADQALD